MSFSRITSQKAPTYNDIILRPSDVRDWHYPWIFNAFVVVPPKPNRFAEPEILLSVSIISFAFVFSPIWGSQSAPQALLFISACVTLVAALVLFPQRIKTFPAELSNWRTLVQKRKALEQRCATDAKIGVISGEFCAMLVQLPSLKSPWYAGNTALYEKMNARQVLEGISIAATITRGEKPLSLARLELIRKHYMLLNPAVRRVFQLVIEFEEKRLNQPPPIAPKQLIMDPEAKSFFLTEPYLLEACAEQVIEEIPEEEKDEFMHYVNSVSKEALWLHEKNYVTIKFDRGVRRRVYRYCIPRSVSAEFEKLVRNYDFVNLERVKFQDFDYLIQCLNNPNELVNSAVANLASLFDIAHLLEHYLTQTIQFQRYEFAELTQGLLSRFKDKSMKFAQTANNHLLIKESPDFVTESKFNAVHAYFCYVGLPNVSTLIVQNNYQKLKGQLRKNPRLRAFLARIAATAGCESVVRACRTPETQKL